MDQRRIGEFLKQLRKEKELTQEQLAEHFYVSSRTVSRWETGKNMPDLDMLIDIAEFYKVDIGDIIDGERESENMENKTKLTFKKVIEYASKEKKLREKLLLLILIGFEMLMLVCMILFGEESKGILYGIVPENICKCILYSVTGLACMVLIIKALDNFGVFDKIIEWKKKKQK